MRHMQPPPDATVLPPGKPFRKGIARWNEWVGDAIHSRNRAYWVALGALALGGLAVWDAHTERNKRQFRVLVVERDPMLNVVNSGDASEVRPLTRAQIAQRFRTWIYNSRSVLVDATALRTNLNNAYASTKYGSAAYRQLMEFHGANPPEEKAARATTYVYRQTALPQGNNSWQVDWCESVTSRDGILQSVEAWRMSATYAIEPPTTEKAALVNPDGWYVIAFGWHRVEDGREAVRTAAASHAAGSSGASTVPVPENCK